MLYTRGKWKMYVVSKLGTSGKWVLLSILYTVSTLTLFQGPCPAFFEAKESWARFWKQGK